jgi:hypothetical protein
MSSVQIVTAKIFFNVTTKFIERRSSGLPPSPSIPLPRGEREAKTLTFDDGVVFDHSGFTKYSPYLIAGSITTNFYGFTEAPNIRSKYLATKSISKLTLLPLRSSRIVVT